MRELVSPRAVALGIVVAAGLAAGGCRSAFDAPAARADLAAPAATAGIVAERSDGDAPPVPAVPSPRKILRSADVTLAVRDHESAGRELARLAEESGGFVLTASERRYTLRVPAAGLERVLERVAALGEVEAQTVSGQDVTTEYVDLEARLRVAEKARQAYLELLSRATSVEEMLKVEQALADVQERIERILARKKYLDEHLELSTVSVSLVELRHPGPLKLVWDGAVWLFSKLVYW